jgi:lysophospholipase L1-like esterase
VEPGKLQTISVFTSLNKIPSWALLSLATNGLLLLTVSLLLAKGSDSSADWSKSAKLNNEQTLESIKVSPSQLQLGPKHRWNYDQWVAQLGREAKAVAKNPPERLFILAGDSITLWFPPELLPPGKTWLNQGISGETSQGLLKRLKLLDETNPETVFVLIGINDLIRGESPETVLENSRLIIRDILWAHPNAQVVVQSILPHSSEDATWEKRDRLLAIPNETIREMNSQLKAIAEAENVYFLDLHPLFADANGNLRLELTTDGLHLSRQGYLVWRSAIDLFSQLKLE